MCACTPLIGYSCFCGKTETYHMAGAYFCTGLECSCFTHDLPTLNHCDLQVGVKGSFSPMSETLAQLDKITKDDVVRVRKSAPPLLL